MDTIKLFAKVRFNRGEGHSPVALVEAMNLEAAVFGYTFGPDLLAALKTLDRPALEEVRGAINAELQTLSGAAVNHVRLFAGFPYETPDHHEFLQKRVLGALQHFFGANKRNDVTLLSCGHAIDNDLFDASQFGACPICLHQVDELTTADEATHPFKAITPLKILGHIDDEVVRRAANAMLARPSSLSADEKTFLGASLHLGLDLPSAVYRENLPFLYKAFETSRIADHVKTATDVLRIAAYLSDETADLSLAEPVRFSLKTSDKKKLLGLMESMTQQNLVEDMLRHRERWLRLGEKINPGSARNRRRFPCAAAAFDMLRRAPQDAPTFNRTIESALRSNNLSRPVVNLLATRPGEFGRRLDVVLRRGEAHVQRHALDMLPVAAKSMTTRMLLDLEKHFATRNDTDVRAFLPKGNANKIQVKDDTRPSIDDEILKELRSVLIAELVSRYAGLPALGRVWIDPALNEQLLPYNRRGDSSTSAPVAKGSRFPFTGDVVRMFVHWTGQDVDLSIMMLDDSFAAVAHASYRNLHGYGYTHSGDITSAPNGASEFIDFEVGTLRQKGVRYVATSLISFSGEPFSAIPCFAGFMERDGLMSGKVFEPKSVALKFDVSVPARSAIPLIFDLKERNVVYVDLATGGSRHAAVAEQKTKFQVLTKLAMTMNQRKPTLFDLCMAHAIARGTPVATREEADTVFCADNTNHLVQDLM